MQEPVAEKIENNTGNAIAGVEVEGGGIIERRFGKTAYLLDVI